MAPAHQLVEPVLDDERQVDGCVPTVEPDLLDNRGSRACVDRAGPHRRARLVDQSKLQSRTGTCDSDRETHGRRAVAWDDVQAHRSGQG